MTAGTWTRHRNQTRIRYVGYLVDTVSRVPLETLLSTFDIPKTLASVDTEDGNLLPGR